MIPIKRRSFGRIVFWKGLHLIKYASTVSCIALAAQSMLGVGGDAGRISPEMQFPVKVDVSKYGQEKPQIEFSRKGDLILCWWFPHPPIGDYHKLLGKCLVVDLEGHILTSATNDNGSLTKNYAAMFSTTLARQCFAWFLSDTNSMRTTLWGFSKDYSLGFRFLKPEGHFSIGYAELWRLDHAAERLWTVRLPEEVGDRGLAAFFDHDDQTNIVVAFEGMKAYVLSSNAGEIVGSFTYGKPETEAEKLNYKQRFGLAGELGDPSLTFLTGPLAFDSSLSLLACGAASGKRVRVISAASPHTMVFEAHSNDNPQRPKGGEWNVNSVSFEANGKYLAAEYEFGGRLTASRVTEAEVFDTKTWRAVWSEQGKGRSTVRAPVISPDGKMMITVRGNWLEIGPFMPQ